jgi:hypothetical protein
MRALALPYFIDYSSTIAGVLTAYDLPDLNRVYRAIEKSYWPD